VLLVILSIFIARGLRENPSISLVPVILEISGRRCNMKNLIKKIPILRSIAKAVYFTVVAPIKSFPGSEDYWKQRYKTGGTSGAGSYGRLAQFKAEAINGIVKEKQISTVIEYGCGDGNQLTLAEYQSYIGFDVSPEAISRCLHTFANDGNKTFKLIDAYANETAQLTLSLDVIYHLIEDEVFDAYMKQLFDSSTRFVIIYSSNTDEQAIIQAPHVKHRKFTEWAELNRPKWKLIRQIPNKYPYSDNEQVETFADFYLYEKT
jgi:SAM-dependent methyltransferase